jgi:hypothetical protein
MVDTKRDTLAATRGAPAPKPTATTAEAGARAEQLNRSPDADQRAAPAAPTGPSAAGRRAETEEWTKQQEAAKKKADAELTAAHGKAAKANANLAKEGSGSRIEPEVRDGEVRYRWGNFVPTRILTDQESEALESMDKA